MNLRSRVTTALRRTCLTGCLAGALLLAASGGLRAQDSWVALGPVGETGNDGIAGRVISLAVDPRNPNRVFAGSASGGLWVSELYDPGKGGGSAGAGNPRDANWRDPSRPYWRWRYVDTASKAGWDRASWRRGDSRRRQLARSQPALLALALRRHRPAGVDVTPAP